MVLEGELVNLDVTSPAATIALGLMYLNPNDEGIAKLFVLPGGFALRCPALGTALWRRLSRSHQGIGILHALGWMGDI